MAHPLGFYRIKKKDGKLVVFFKKKNGLQLYGVDPKVGELFTVEIKPQNKKSHYTATVDPSHVIFWSPNRTTALKTAISYLKEIDSKI